mmetsp:Transcript_59872/g.110872  ORF Transcript_59872/g.110872 Transcript_59872/m.110872 type:complete len:386 (+) Transcript_59872:63-1220(+)
MVDNLISIATRWWQAATSDAGNGNLQWPGSGEGTLPRRHSEVVSVQPMPAMAPHERRIAPAAETAWFGGSCSSTDASGRPPLHAPVPRRLRAQDTWSSWAPERTQAQRVRRAAAPYQPMPLDRPLLRLHQGPPASVQLGQMPWSDDLRPTPGRSSSAGLESIKGGILRPLDAALGQYLDSSDNPPRDLWPMDLPPRRRKHLCTRFPRVELQQMPRSEGDERRADETGKVPDTTDNVKFEERGEKNGKVLDKQPFVAPVNGEMHAAPSNHDGAVNGEAKLGVSSSSADFWRAQVEAVYRRRNPPKLKSVPELLAKHKGNEAVLYAKVCKTYDLDPKKMYATDPSAWDDEDKDMKEDDAGEEIAEGAATNSSPFSLFGGPRECGVTS